MVDDPVKEVRVRIVHVRVVRVHLLVAVLKHRVPHDVKVDPTHFLEGLHCRSYPEVEMAKAGKAGAGKHVLRVRFSHLLLEPPCPAQIKTNFFRRGVAEFIFEQLSK